MFELERKNGDTMSFRNGVICSSSYSYEISSYGYIELTPDETKELYLKMKKFYEVKK